MTITPPEWEELRQEFLKYCNGFFKVSGKTAWYADLARFVGVNKATAMRWIKGQRNPKYEHICQIRQYLENLKKSREIS